MLGNERIRAMALAEGVDYFGVADLAPAKQAILEQGGPVVASFPLAVSLGIRMFDEVVDLLPGGERWVRISYKHDSYDVINSRLDQLGSRIAGQLQRGGYRAMPVPASKRADSERICAIFSHKMAAHLAGLGWIGKSCLLVTPDHGPRVRWTTVLTDAPLQATGKAMAERCGSCHACVDACPVRAFTNRPFREEEPREARYDASKCDRYFDEMERRGDVQTCGLCVAACPHGRKGAKK